MPESNNPSQCPAAITLPLHVAFIMDGNGRWAKQQGLSRAAGHQAGVKAIEAIIRLARQKGIAYLTFFGFSSENWRRPASEVRHLFDLFYQTLRDSIPKLRSQGIRLRFIGDLTKLPKRLQQVINKAESMIDMNIALTVTIALNYGGRWDILSAMQKAIAKGADLMQLEEAVTANLSMHGIPDPDLLIRTSGEHRVSNFLLWQIAYT
jgi:undecaprenyl diphosphate synthase